MGLLSEAVTDCIVVVSNPYTVFRLSRGLLLLYGRSWIGMPYFVVWELILLDVAREWFEVSEAAINP